MFACVRNVSSIQDGLYNYFYNDYIFFFFHFYLHNITPNSFAFAQQSCEEHTILFIYLSGNLFQINKRFYPEKNNRLILIFFQVHRSFDGKSEIKGNGQNSQKDNDFNFGGGTLGVRGWVGFCSLVRNCLKSKFLFSRGGKERGGVGVVWRDTSGESLG